MEFGLENHLHECVAVVKYFAKALHVCFWKKAPGLKEIINIQYVTAIAAFNNNVNFMTILQFILVEQLPL